MSGTAPRELYEAVRALSPDRVATELHLTPAPKAGKGFYACVACASSDALHRAPKGGWRCFSCGWTGSNVDLAAVVYGMTPGDACRTLADRLGVYVASAHDSAPPLRSSRARLARRGISASRAFAPLDGSNGRIGAKLQEPASTPLDALRADGIVPQEPSSVYRAIVETLGALTHEGAAYLRSRGLDPDRADAYGFRAIGPSEWETLRDALESIYLGDELEAAGLYRCAEGETEAKWAPPWRGQVSALLIPYFYAGNVVALKFRNLRPRDKDDRYRTLSPIGVDRATLPPFNADVLDRSQRQTLHITEGELNAVALSQSGALAVGLPSALWPDAWTAKLEDARRLVVWFDNDEGSNRKADTFGAQMQGKFGGWWRQQRCQRITLPTGDDGRNLDANDLLMRGTLGEYIERAEQD